MCSVSYLCRFLSYCLQLVSYPYFITDCLSSVSLSFFFCFELNLISLYCWYFASNNVYCLTLIHINTHYTIQYTHTQKGMFVHVFYVYIVLFYIVFYFY